MNDYDFGRTVIRINELLHTLREPMPQSQQEMDIIVRYTVELGQIVRRVLTPGEILDDRLQLEAQVRIRDAEIEMLRDKIDLLEVERNKGL
jgi:hypothetical protein